MPITELSLAVVGADYPNSDGGNRRSEIIFCTPGEPVDLRLDPKNKADPHAVAVLSARGFQIGYLRADRAPWIGGMLKQGRPIIAVFQAEAPFGAWIRANINGNPPVLPAPSERDNGAEEVPDWDPDFYPDEEPADE